MNSIMKISWITPTNFVDVDLPIIVELQKECEIYWQVVSFGAVDNDMKHYIEPKLKGTNNTIVEYVEIPFRFYDLRTMRIFCKVLKKAKAYGPDLYYTSLQAAPFGPFIYRIYLPLDKTVAACHNVSTPKGANQETYARIFTHLHLQMFHNIQVFSESQRDILYKKFPKKNVLLAPLAIKDYGEPTIQERNFDKSRVVFLFFGMILSYKRVDLLIDAAQSLYEKGYRNFVVRIAGKCKDWASYDSKIHYPEIFDLQIEHIPNEAVADLFATSDYFVMPYQDIAQSGAITVAFRYNIPIILSNLPQFKPFVQDGVNGVYFEKGDVKDLERKMGYVISSGEQLNDQLKKGLETFVDNNYSTPVIASNYYIYFKRVLTNTKHK